MNSNGKVSAKEENGSPSDDIVSPKNTSKRKYLIGPVTFLGLLGYATYASTIFLYYPYNVGKALFPNISVASENSAVCGSNTNGTGVENGQLIQSDVATFLVYSAVLEGIPCILSNLVYGSSSDRFGIKKMLLIPIIGLMLTEGLILVFMHYQFTLLYFLIPLVINGFGGEAFAIIQFTLSYASKITNTNKERTIAMAIMEICIGMGLLLGSITAGYIIRLSGFMWSLITSLLINIVNIVLIFSLPENTKKRNNEPWRVIHVFNSFKDSLQFYYSKKYAGLRLKFILCISIFIIGCVVLIGRNNTEILYTISPPFCLNSIQVGWFHATRGVMQHGIAMILIRLFMMCMRAESIAMIGAVSGTISLIVEGFANSTVVLFLTQVIGFGTSLGVVMVRVIMSREIPAENQGALFGGMSAFQTACTFFGSLIFSTMYRSTLYFFKGTIFLLMAGMFFISLVLTIAKMSLTTESETTSSEQETAKEEITSRRKYLIGPFVFLHTLTLTLYNTSINLYYPYHVGRELFPNESVTKEKSSLCQSRTNSSSTNEQIVQSVVAEYSVYAAISMGFPCLISNMLLGSMSDRYGRKQLLIIPTLGLLVARIIVVVFMYVSVDLYYFLLPSIILAGFGDIFAVFQISLSYISDITEASKKRTFGIALLELSGGIGVLLGQIMAGYLIQSLGYTLTVLFTCIVKSANLINIVLLPSSVPSTKSQWSCKVVIRSLKESFQFYYSKEFSGSRWKYNLCLIIFIIGNMTVIGRDNVETLYIISPPFCFTPVLVGWFNATKAVMQLIIPMILIRVFLKFWSNEFITVFGAISGLSYFVVETLARSTLTLFLAPVFGFGLVLGFVIIRAIVSVETPGNKQGALYGGLAAIQTIFAFFGSMVFSAIYKNTVHTNKRIFLIFIIVLLVVTLIMSIILYMKSRSRIKQYTLKSKEIDIAATEHIERY